MIKIYQDTHTGNYIALDTSTGMENTLRISHENKTGKDWLVLPPNEYNRKIVNRADVDNNGGVLEIDTYKTPRSPSTGVTKTDAAPTGSWYLYLTDDEKQIINDLKSKAQKRLLLEKKKAELERIQKEYDELLDQE